MASGSGGDGTRAHLFDKQADSYKKYRPSYSQELFNAIYDYAGPSARTDVALDVATGSGQAAQELAKRYSRVIGQDPSEAQLAAADHAASNIEYQVASAENTRLPDGSVDLITVAQALHWLDLQQFYTEAHRVLRPGGVLAAWCYDLACLSDEDADVVFRKLYKETLGPYWDDRRFLIDQHYPESMEPQAPLFEDVRRWSYDMPAPMTVSGLLGMISSWSSYNNYREKHKDRPDPLMMFHGELRDAVEFENHKFEFDGAFYPVYMIMARKPL